MNLRVDTQLAHLSGNELGILRPEVKNQGFIHRQILAEGQVCFNAGRR